MVLSDRHASRVLALQEELLADDLEPPPQATDWPDRTLRSWFEHAGAPSEELQLFLLAMGDDLADKLLFHGICSLEELLHNEMRWRRKQLGLTIGCHARLQSALVAEAKRQASEAEIAKQRAADMAFRFDVVAHALAGVDDPGCGHADTQSVEFTILPPPLPCGGVIELGSAGELGGRVWPCAGLLCRYLHKHAAELGLSGASVIELGAGTGLTGLYAAGLGARQLLLTDVFLTVAEGKENLLRGLLQANIERNRGVCAGCALMEVAELNFCVPEQAETCARRERPGCCGFDLVLAADVTYQGIGVNFAELSAVVHRVLRRGGIALIAHESRRIGSRLAPDGGDPALATLRKEAEAVGLRWEIAYDDRLKYEFVQNGQRCIIRLTHAGKGAQPH